MIAIRDFCEKDAVKIVGWIKDEREFYHWSADRYGHYPISCDEIVSNYKKCAEKTFFKPFMLEADGKAVGHFILRTPSSDPKVIRIGFVIVDKNERGKGYGKKLINLAVEYAKNALGASEINLGVFTDNEDAVACYRSLGFVFAPDDSDDEIHSFDYKNEKWTYGKMIFVGKTDIFPQK